MGTGPLASLRCAFAQTLSFPLLQLDWQEREFIEGLVCNVKKITDFLNKFDSSTRFRLAKVNEKLSQLENQMAYLEAAVATVRQT